MAGSSEKPLTASEYLLGAGTLLSLYLVYSIFVLLSGGDIVPESPRPTRQQIENLSPPDGEYEIKKKQSGEAALLFFASFLGPILLIVGWSIRDKKRPTVSRHFPNGQQQFQFLIGQRTAEQSHPPEPAAGPDANGESSPPAR